MHTNRLLMNSQINLSILSPILFTFKQTGSIFNLVVKKLNVWIKNLFFKTRWWIANVCDYVYLRWDSLKGKGKIMKFSSKRLVIHICSY